MVGKVAIVTGGNRGIGFEIVKTLFSEGFLVACLDRSDSDQLDEIIQGSSGRIKMFNVDISNLENIKKAVKEVEAYFGRIDVLINNAGVSPKERRDLLDMSEESFDFVLGVNLKGTFFMTQEVAKQMINQDNRYFPPKIINIASMSSYTSSITRGEYCISKAGVSMVTTLFADKLAEYGISVFEIRPGIIKTEMTSSVTEKYDIQIENGLLPIKRWGIPEDIANAVILLCSPKLTYITGQAINIDGGFHIRRL